MDTLRIKIDPKNPDAKALEPAVDLLRNGGLVSFPTETVYGLGVDAKNLEAMARMRWLKNRPATKPFAFLVSAHEEAEKLAGSLPAAALRITEQFWPGPLTIIVPGPAGQEIGLRFPAHAVPQELLRQLGNPIAATSGNVSGDVPSVAADDVAQVFEGKIECIIDGGTTVLRQSSTVVRFKPQSYEILRLGIITEDMLAPLIQKRILIVCKGNTCRSPMAEGFLKHMISEHHDIGESMLRNYGYFISSAGTGAAVGNKASMDAVAAMKENSIDISRHLTRKLTDLMTQRSDFIITMSNEIAEYVRRLDPDASERILVLDPAGIEDPAGSQRENYLRIRNMIENRLKENFSRFTFERR
ncbi:MAG: L-threonylcarbamoyladenylate synthase [Planctomycetota bacterium]|jgi:L-threonylcarbamoyladenylate synthase